MIYIIKIINIDIIETGDEIHLFINVDYELANLF